MTLETLLKTYPLIYLLFLYLTITIFFHNKYINNISITLCIYFLLKWITNYRKCTISYIECKLRGVSKEKGYINQVLDSILDYNKHKYRFYIYLFTFLLLLVHFFIKKFYY